MLKGFVIGLTTALIIFAVFFTQVIIIEGSGFVYGLRKAPSPRSFFLEIRKEHSKIVDVMNVLTEGGSDRFQTDLIFASMVPDHLDYILFSTVTGHSHFFIPIERTDVTLPRGEFGPR